METLLGQPGGASEGPQDDHPNGSWRADALGKSRHARLSEHLQEPLDERDAEKARRLCAEVCRNLLGDMAPALVLVKPAERYRCQVLATWLQTLFDFAGQPGVEGERLSALNRLEFALEQALDGEPIGQPVFLGMAAEESRRPWSRRALDSMMAAARRRIVRPRLQTVDEVDVETSELARAVVGALVGEACEPPVVALGAAILRLRYLLDLGAAMRRDRAALAISELPSRADLREVVDQERLDAAVCSELARIRPALEDARVAGAVPSDFRTAVRYLRLAGLALADRVEALGAQVVCASPKLGVGARLRLLVLARLP